MRDLVRSSRGMTAWRLCDFGRERMGSATTKTIWTLAIVACLLGTVGHTQTIIGAELAELARVFRGAVGLIAQAIVGVDRVEARQIPNAERSQAIEELRNISRALS